MGYHIQQTASKFKIRARNIPQALKAAKAVVRQHLLPLRSRTVAAKLAELFWQWGWNMRINRKTGDIVSIDFEGEKLLEEDALFNAIGPYVEAGSLVAVIGADLEAWRWYFDGEGAVNQPGTIVYEFARAVVEVRGGVARVTECPPGLEVQIVNRDHKEAARVRKAA